MRIQGKEREDTRAAAEDNYPQSTSRDKVHRASQCNRNRREPAIFSHSLTSAGARFFSRMISAIRGKRRTRFTSSFTSSFPRCPASRLRGKSDRSRRAPIWYSSLAWMWIVTARYRSHRSLGARINDVRTQVIANKGTGYPIRLWSSRMDSPWDKGAFVRFTFGDDLVNEAIDTDIVSS